VAKEGQEGVSEASEALEARACEGDIGGGGLRAARDLLGEQRQVLAGNGHALDGGADDVTVSNRDDVCHTCGAALHARATG
jgi:hypothetical protein